MPLESSPDDTSWSDRFFLSGLQGTVRSLVVYNGDLIAGGDFVYCSGVKCNHIARWDGSNWVPMGDGFDGIVRALLVSNGTLIAGGEHTAADLSPVGMVAQWDGSRWTQLGDGPSTSVYSLTEYDNSIVAGHAYNSQGIASKWTGSSWQVLPGKPLETPYALAVYQGRLFVGGSVGYDVGACSVGAWDGSSWSIVLPAGQIAVRSLAVYDDKLVAAGSAIATGAGIATWDGHTWTNIAAVNAWSEEYGVLAMVVHNHELYVAGGFMSFNDTPGPAVYRWDGSTWSPASGYFGSTIYALAFSGDDVVLGCGYYYFEYDLPGGPVQSIVDGVRTPLSGSRHGLGLNGQVHCLVVFDDKLIAGGSFLQAGDVTCSHIAAFDGTQWTPLDSGLDDTPMALTVYNGSLIAAGPFTTAGGQPANHIARWDGHQWYPLGPGLSSSTRAIAVYQGNLIAAGTFSPGVGQPNCLLARWDGSSWTYVGFDGKWSQTIFATAEFNGELYLAGTFQPASQNLPASVVKWDGSNWTPLPKLLSLTPRLNSFAVFDGALMVATNFKKMGKWDGANWSTIPVSGMQVGLGVYNGELVTVGDNYSYAPPDTFFVASWNGSSWRYLGSGINGLDYTPMVSYHNSLFIGGPFLIAGGKPSAHIGQWTNLGRHIADLSISPNPVIGLNSWKEIITAGNFVGGLTADSFDLTSFLVNGTVAPTSISIVPTAEGFTGPVIQLQVRVGQFQRSFTRVDTGQVAYTVNARLKNGYETTIAGTVQVIDPNIVRRGDVDGNGVADVTDLSKVVDYVFNLEPPAPGIMNADFDGDGMVDIADVAAFIDYLFPSE